MSLPDSRVPRPRGRLLAALLMVTVTGCGTDTPPVAEAEIPRLDLVGMEAPVAAALERARQKVLGDTVSAAAWGRLGMVCQAHDLYDPAVQAYEQAARLDPADYRWPYLGALSLATADAQGALALFSEAADLEPDNAGFHVAHGDHLSLQSLAEEARVAYGRALALQPDLTHALYGLAALDLTAGDVDAAREQLERAARLAPHHGEVHKLLAQVCLRQGDEECARISSLSARAYAKETAADDDVVRVLREQAAGSRAHSRRGLALAAQQSYVEAEAAFRRVLEIREGNARDYANLGGALAGQGRTAEAVEAFRTALEIDAGEAHAHSNLAVALMEQGNLAVAESHLRAALESDPGHADAWFNLGLLRQTQGSPEAARAAYESTLSSDPAHRGARNNLARALAEGGDREAAGRQLAEAVAIDPFNLEAAFNLAMFRRQTGDHAGAVSALHGAMQRAPNSSLLARALAWELATAPDDAVRDGAEAVRLAGRVFQAYPEQIEVADAMAAAWAEIGRFDMAVEVGSRAVDLAAGQGQTDRVPELRRRLEVYRAEQPWRQPR